MSLLINNQQYFNFNGWKLEITAITNIVNSSSTDSTSTQSYPHCFYYSNSQGYGYQQYIKVSLKCDVTTQTPYPSFTQLSQVKEAVIINYETTVSSSGDSLEQNGKQITYYNIVFNFSSDHYYDIFVFFE